MSFAEYNAAEKMQIGKRYANMKCSLEQLASENRFDYRDHREVAAAMLALLEMVELGGDSTFPMLAETTAVFDRVQAERLQKRMDDEYYTPRQVAKKLDTSVRTIYELIASGQLESVKVATLLRVSSSALNDYVDAQPKKEDLCDVTEVARTLQVHQRTISELIANGDLEAVKIRGHRSRMIIRESLNAYLSG